MTNSNMNKIIIVILTGLFISIFISCNDSGDEKIECDDTNTACSQVPPTNEICSAFFQKWFYDNQTKRCNLVSYSGCSDLGFKTKKECEACNCDR